MSNHKELIKKFLINNFLFGDEEKLKDNTDFFNSGIVDSTGILELVGFLESTFSIKINDDELIISNFSSLNSVTSFLDRKLNSREN